jgi:hypothetical protein
MIRFGKYLFFKSLLIPLLLANPALSQVKNGLPLYVDPTEYSLQAERNNSKLSPEALRRLRNRLKRAENLTCNLRGFTVDCKFDPNKKKYVLLANIPAIPFLGNNFSSAKTNCEKSGLASDYGRSSAKKADLAPIEVPENQTDIAEELRNQWDACLFFYEASFARASEVEAGTAWFEWWEDFWRKGISANCEITCPVVIKRRDAKKTEYHYCISDRLSANEYRTPYTCGIVAYVDPNGVRFLAIYSHSDGVAEGGGQDTTLGLRISCELPNQGELPDVAMAIKVAVANPPIHAINERKETKLLPGHPDLWKRDSDENEESYWTYWKSFGSSSIRPGWFDRYVLEVAIGKHLESRLVRGKTVPYNYIEVYIRGMIYATRKNLENDLRLPDNSLFDDFGQKIIRNVQSTLSGSRCTYE